jgi:hypothetical protein
MKDLILEEKTGFSSIMPFDIYESSGILFYSSEFTDKISKGERLNFNLPHGEYKYNGNFIKLDSPVAVKNVPLPMKERRIAGKRYKIEFGNNPNKCTIFYDKGLILFDSSFLNKPLYIKYLIYNHELGHHFYKSEDKADLYAVKRMLERGFNPSQIGRGALESLSDRSMDRIMKIVNLLTDNNA